MYEFDVTFLTVICVSILTVLTVPFCGFNGHHKFAISKPSAVPELELAYCHGHRDTRNLGDNSYSVSYYQI